MGLDLTIFEVMSEHYDNNKEKHHGKHLVSEVLYFSGGTANILANWLYKNHFKENSFNESYAYIEIYSEDFEEFLHAIDKVLTASETKRDTYALFYLPPCNNNDEYISSPKMFEEDYYRRLELLKTEISSLIYDENGELLLKKFVYNICW